MRIITGLAKGRKLMVPEGNNTRPTLDRVKESLFNIISNNLNINDSKVLDLFAGSGGLVLNALAEEQSFAFFAKKIKIHLVI